MGKIGQDEEAIAANLVLAVTQPSLPGTVAAGSNVDALDATHAAGSNIGLDETRAPDPAGDATPESVTSTRDRDATELARRLRVVTLAVAAIGVANIVYFLARFVIGADPPQLHPDFRATSAPGAFESMAILDGPIVSLVRITVIATIFLVVALWVAHRNRRDPMVPLLSALAILGGQYSLSVAVLTSTETLAIPRALAATQYLVLSIAGFTVMALFPSGRSSPRWAIWIVPLAALPFVAQAFVMVRDHGYSVPIAAVAFPLGALFLAFQWRRYRGDATLRERHQILWLTYAVIAFVGLQALAVLGLIPLLADRSRAGFPLIKLAFELVLASSYLVALASMMFSAARYRLWDIDRVINRTIVYTLVTLVLAAVLGLIYFVLRAALGEVLHASATIGAALSLAVAIALFTPARRRIGRWIDRRFYGIGLDYEALVAKAVRAAHASLPTTSSAFASYDELHLLGRGGMGAVYRAHHADFAVPVALKVMSPALADDPDAQARFRREAQILEGLHHPNVVPFLASGHERGLAFIAMQYVEGEDLGAVLRRCGRFTLAEVAAVVDQLAGVLDTSHARGVVHRDLKPSNILLEGRASDPIAGRRPLVMDFGVAKLAGDFDAPAVEGALVGSLPYIPPEQIENADAVDGRADLYALAATVYELLVGRPPFRESTPLGLVMAHLKQPAPDPRALVPSLPAHAAAAILTALAKAPADRQPTIAAFAAQLRA